MNPYLTKIKEYYDYSCSPLQFLADDVFDFTTDDPCMSEFFAKKAVEVCKTITDRTTFDYIKDKEDYQWFLVMCNMPFFADKISYGVSIRGAWWEDNITYRGDKFSLAQWEEFIRAVIEFSETEFIP